MTVAAIRTMSAESFIVTTMVPNGFACGLKGKVHSSGPIKILENGLFRNTKRSPSGGKPTLLKGEMAMPINLKLTRSIVTARKRATWLPTPPSSAASLRYTFARPRSGYPSSWQAGAQIQFEPWQSICALDLGPGILVAVLRCKGVYVVPRVNMF